MTQTYCLLSKFDTLEIKHPPIKVIANTPNSLKANALYQF